MGHNHIPFYEDDEDSKRKCSFHERFWEALNIKYEDKQMAQFGGALRKRAFIWYMNFTENQQRTKDEIKENFLYFFKGQYVKHIVLYARRDRSRL
jgi:hypothetical protein